MLDIEGKIQAIAAVETGETMNAQLKVSSLVSRYCILFILDFLSD